MVQKGDVILAKDIDEKGEILRCAAKSMEIRNHVRKYILQEVRTTPAVDQNALIIMAILDVMTDMKQTIDKLGIDNPKRKWVIDESFKLMCEGKNINGWNL
jgi:pyruvate-formate lyase